MENRYELLRKESFGILVDSEEMEDRVIDIMVNLITREIERDKMKQEELLERITNQITEFNLNKDKIIDEDIRLLRMGLSSDLYSLIDVCYIPAANLNTHCYIELERSEAISFNEELKQAQVEGYSNSQSESIARKRAKGNDAYLEAVKNYRDSKTSLDSIDKIMRMGQQVLNSMSKRVNF